MSNSMIPDAAAASWRSAAPRNGSTGFPLAWSVVRDVERLAALEPEWRRLSTPPRFFVGPDWVLTWLRTRAGEGVTPHVLVAREPSGAVVGLLPLVETDRGDLEPPGRLDGVAHVDVLAEIGREAQIAAGVVDLLSMRAEGRVRLARLSQDGALTRALLARAGDLPVLLRPATVCPFVSFTGGWDGFLSSLDRHYRQDAKRQVRRFFERPDARLHWATEPADVSRGMETLFDLHGKRFESLRRASDFLGPGRREFHLALAASLAARGDLALGTLTLAGRSVSSVYGFHHGETTHLFNTGVEPEALSMGAGFVLRVAFVERAARRVPAADVDFLDGCYEWKIRWASGVSVLVDADLWPRTTLGSGSRIVRGAIALARSRAAAWVRGRRCPGRPDGALAASEERCRRTACPYAAGRSAPSDRGG